MKKIVFYSIYHVTDQQEATNICQRHEFEISQETIWLTEITLRYCFLMTKSVMNRTDEFLLQRRPFRQLIIDDNKILYVEIL